MTKQKFRLAAVIILALLVIVLIVQNREVAVTHLFLWTVSTPRFVLLGSTFLIGGLAGYMIGRGTRPGSDDSV